MSKGSFSSEYLHEKVNLAWFWVVVGARLGLGAGAHVCGEAIHKADPLSCLYPPCGMGDNYVTRLSAPEDVTATRDSEHLALAVAHAHGRVRQLDDRRLFEVGLSLRGPRWVEIRLGLARG